MRVLAYVALFGVAVASYIWVVQWLKDRRAGQLPMRRQPPALPTAPGVATELSASAPSADLGERAALAYGPDAGSGVLRLTPSQLVFAADSGRVLVIERLDITGVGVSRDLPDRTLAQPVLVVTTGSDVVYVLVDSPEVWEWRLTHGG